MTELSSVFFVIFVVSFGLTLVSLFSGLSSTAHVGGLGHSTAGHGLRWGHVPHGDAWAHGGHPGAGAHSHSGQVGGHGAQIAPVNMATGLAFLTWFGGVGFLVTAYTGLGAALAIVAALGAGLVGAGVIFWFLARILLPGQTAFLDDSDFDLVGTVGRLSVGIRPDGTGELVYSKGGGRHVLSARTENGASLERGSEVVVVRYERGVAFVELFDEFVHSDGMRG